MKKPWHHIIQFVCFMAMLMAVVLQGLTHLVKTKPLYVSKNQPVYKLEKKPFNGETWHSGEYQLYLAEWAWKNTGFREFFCRSYNQMGFSCFGKTNNPNAVKGRKKELYLLGNLRDVTGQLFGLHYATVEEAKADAQKNVAETLTLIDTLQRHGTHFLFVFCPTKPIVYPEYVPKPYRDNLIDFSMADYYIDLFKENGIPHIDFYNYFKAIRDTVSYPLYTRFGSHWSESTMPFVADSILRKLAEVGGYKLPKVATLDLNLTRDYSIQDGELEPGLNLLFPLAKPKLPRPKFVLTDTLGTDRPNLLVVGDGYFNQLQHSCFVDAFNQWDFWLYNKTSVSSRPSFNWKYLNQLFNTAETLEQTDIVIALFTSNYLLDYMGGFTHTALNLYEKGCTSEQEMIQSIINSIKENPEWFQAIERQAKEKGITTEDNLLLNAEYVLKMNIENKQP